MRLPLVIASVALTAFCWGVYGPVLHVGQHEMGMSLLRPFICVGLAYFIIAVLVPLALLRSKGEKGQWTASGTVWSLLAGAAGAFGALGIILAFTFRGNPVYVMPLVFGCAPVVNTFTTMWMSKTYHEAGAIFFLGILVVALGAAGVMFYKPVAKNVQVITADDGSITIVQSNLADNSKTTWNAKDLDDLKTNEKLAGAYKTYLKSQPLTFREVVMIPLAIALTALCWGAYGPVLHQGQMKMGGSRLRPLLCVGLAYFAIAVVVPIITLGIWKEPGRFFGETGHFWQQFAGVIWSLAGGAAGAIGALGIIMAFNYGGKPIFVMPLVFGCAPLVNTAATIWKDGTIRNVDTPFLISLLVAITGAVTVLLFAPKAPHKSAAPEKPTTDAKAVKPASPT